MAPFLKQPVCVYAYCRSQALTNVEREKEEAMDKYNLVPTRLANIKNNYGSDSVVLPLPPAIEIATGCEMKPHRRKGAG